MFVRLSVLERMLTQDSVTIGRVSLTRASGKRMRKE